MRGSCDIRGYVENEAYVLLYSKLLMAGENETRRPKLVINDIQPR